MGLPDASLQNTTFLVSPNVLTEMAAMMRKGVQWGDDAVLAKAVASPNDALLLAYAGILRDVSLIYTHVVYKYVPHLHTCSI